MVKTITKKGNVINHKLPNNYLAIRVGKVYKNDPIKEIDNVIKSHKYGWFAKFGRVVSQIRLDRMLSKSTPYLVIVKFDGDKYISKTYKILETAQKTLRKGEPYPSYYSGNEQFVGTWFKVEKTDNQVDVNSLVVKSSFQSLTHALTKSMCGSFSCTTMY